MKPISRLAFSFVLATALTLTGCASFERTLPAPQQAQPIAVQIINEPLSAWSDMPIGVYRVPESNTVISGQQQGGMAPVLLFGLIGLAAQHAAGASASEEAVREIEKSLRIDVGQQAQTASRRVIDSGLYPRHFTNQTDAAGPKLNVSGSLLMTFVDDKSVRPWVVLKATLMDAKTKEPIWSTRYFSSTSGARPLAGENSWTANSGELLQRAVAKDVEHSVAFMLKDISAPHMRDENALTTVQSHFPFVRQRLQSVGFKLAEDEKIVTFIPRVGDIIVFAGVNILDKSSAVVRGATKDDINAFLKIVEEETKIADATQIPSKTD